MEKSGGPLEGRRSDGEPVAAQTPRFDVVGVVLRVRRQLDLSQRDLARRLGVSHAAIARVEANRNGIDVADLERLVGLEGMRLAVLDESGAEMAPIPPDWVRDNAGRRLPVHLDVRPPDDRPRSRLTDIHYDRAEPNAWYHHRAHRDERRARGLHAVNDDGPTTSALRFEAQRRLRDRLERAASLARRDPILLDDCRCRVDCWEAGDCAADCDCECGT